MEAATALELPRTAVMSLEVLAANSPKDRDVAIKFAHGAGGHRPGGAGGEDPGRPLPPSSRTDNELAQALKDLSARKTLDEGGYDALADGTGSYRDILKDKEEAVSLEQQNRQVKTEDVAERLIGEYEARLKTEPKNLKLLRQLAELYTQKKQFDRALELLRADQGVGGGRRRVAGPQHRGHRWCGSSTIRLPSSIPTRRTTRTRWRSSRPRSRPTSWPNARSASERFPTDLQIRFELGQLYFQMGKITEAIKEFQKAQGNPAPAHSGAELPGPVLRPARHERPGRHAPSRTPSRRRSCSTRRRRS